MRYCTWDHLFVQGDERECPVFTLENGMHKLGHTSWMMCATTTAAEDFAMLRRQRGILSPKLQCCVSVAATSTVCLVLGHVHVTNAQKNFLLCHVFQGLHVLIEQIQVKILAGPFQIILKGLDSLP